MTDKIKVLDKPANELTVRDSLKINGVVLAVTAGVMTAWYGWASISDRLRTRKLAKQINDIDFTAEIKMD